jgi:hypothetical protein
MATIETETLRPGFEKYHIKELPFDAVIHKISAPDHGMIHDHPFSFTSHILKGGYYERVYHVNGYTWWSEIVYRSEGTSHRVEATCIHEILSLPHGECWTLIIPSAKERESGFWQFREDGIYFREWHEEHFKKYTP